MYNVIFKILSQLLKSSKIAISVEMAMSTDRLKATTRPCWIIICAGVIRDRHRANHLETIKALKDAIKLAVAEISGNHRLIHWT